MFTAPAEMVAVIVPFAPVFVQERVWHSAQTLVWGAILAHGRRTVASALRAVGLAGEARFTTYHRVLNRSRFALLTASRILLSLVLSFVPDQEPFVVGLDDTIERRRARHIADAAAYRDPTRSTRAHTVTCFGLRWLSMMALVPVPWSRRRWALPLMTVLSPPPPLPSRASAAGRRAKAAGAPKPPRLTRRRSTRSWAKATRLGTCARTRPGQRRHKTVSDLGVQMLSALRRWLPSRAIVAVFDGAFSSHKLAKAGVRRRITIVTRVVMEAAFYDEPAPKPATRKGPQPSAGRRQPSLRARCSDERTVWEEVEVDWYGGERRRVELSSGVALWSDDGRRPVRVRWVLSRQAPSGAGVRPEPEAFVCTDVEASPRQIIEWFVMRWNVEVTFEEARRHLGLETQRQWSATAVARTTPVLLGLFSVVTLMSKAIVGQGQMPVQSSAWYEKPAATFSDCIALVRRQLWSARYLPLFAQTTGEQELQRRALEALLDALPLAS